MSHLWLLLPLLLTACSFDRSGLRANDGSSDITATDQRSVDLTGPDALLDLVDSTALDTPDPCSPNPCQNGGSCTQGDGGAICQCATGFDGPSCDECALGHKGPICAECPKTKLTIQSCTHAFIDCDKWIDGNNKTDSYDECLGAGGCFATDVDFDLGSRQFVHRLRFLSDWHAKRPGTWELWASDDNMNFSLVMDARSNKSPWQCVQDDPCTPEVPTECCPNGGLTQDIKAGWLYPKWDDFSFSGVVAQHWRFRIKTTDDSDTLIMRELELYGHDCLGEVACATSICGKGVCTGQENAHCSCASCQPPASCTSAFTSGVAPPCTTPPP